MKPEKSLLEQILGIGNNVFIRTVTHYYTGKVAAVSADFVVLADAAWVADTGRFSKALVEGTLEEVEPFPDLVAVGKACIVDATIWRHALPRDIR
jgi:hypothetical protein